MSNDEKSDEQDSPVTRQDHPDTSNTAASTQLGPFWNSFYLLRNRVLAGFVVALPVIITFIIIKWLYEFLAKDVIGYTANALIRLWRVSDEPAEKANTGSTELDAVIDITREVWFVNNILAPVTAILLIGGVLFMLGMLFRSRWHRFFDWVMSSVPGVGVIYKSVNNVIDSVRSSSDEEKKFQRVVLVKFPHPGMKVPAFVTSSCTDSNTGKEILCVYVPTTPLPTSGYMILVPVEEVTEISWELQETLQAIVSGGITVPPTVEYTIGVVNSPVVNSRHNEGRDGQRVGDQQPNSFGATPSNTSNPTTQANKTGDTESRDKGKR